MRRPNAVIVSPLVPLLLLMLLFSLALATVASEVASASTTAIVYAEPSSEAKETAEATVSSSQATNDVAMSGSTRPVTPTGDNVAYACEYSNCAADSVLANRPSQGDKTDSIDGQDLDQSGVISGTVYKSDGSEPLPFVNVWTTEGGYDGCTDVDGDYAIAGLPDGQYKVSTGGGWNSCLDKPSVWVREYYYETANANLATTLSISSTQPLLSGIDFTLDPGGIITGTVYDSEGSEPLPLVNVRTSKGGYRSCTDADGHYVLAGLPYSAYTISAGGDWNWCTDGHSDYVREYYRETSDYDQAEILTLDAGSQLVGGIDFTLARPSVYLPLVTRTHE